ncbi:CoA transferase [Kribbella sp. HUAS MG21]|uniref:CoA transferase n=1 Tax=Kribbella sp. HUAS MG21 TaxID=3160966 RepID=A0AAU7T7A7_9ACTN
MEAEELPLAGVVVLDFSQFLAGPVAALRLADLGARVIKIERPVTGEIGRTLAFAGRWADEDTVSFHAMNRNKEAVVADLKDPADLERVKSLVARADVLLHNFRPGVMERLGLDYESARALNPSIIYAAASGYGPEGPWSNRPGQDLLAQSISGLTWTTGRNRPTTVGLSLADHLLSCHLAQGVTALLLRKARTGQGGHTESSLLEAMLDLQTIPLTTHLNTPTNGAGPTDAADDVLPARLYRTADGYLAVGVVRVAELVGVVGESVSVEGGLVVERDVVEEWVGERLVLGKTAEWVEVLGRAGIECAPLRTLDEVIASEEFRAIGMTQEVVRPAAAAGGTPLRLTTTRSPIRIDGEVLRNGRAAPRLGAQGYLRDGVDPLKGGR